jgi:tetratricopeptide (TPR) repeat protein
MKDPERQKEASLLVWQAKDAFMWYGDYEETISLLTKAIQLDPDSGEIYHNRGMAYCNLQRWSEALADFNRAIALAPHPSSYEQRGIVYYQMGDRESARKDLEQALRMDPRRAVPLVNLGWLCIEEGRYREAVDYCTRAIAIEPTLSSAYTNRARAYLELGDSLRGLADLQRADELAKSGRDTSNVDVREKF